jgi:ubiquinone/menaquinone biosynthesis C-methylase UbiE
MDRGMTGVLPRTTRLEDESYLDFVETFREKVVFALFPKVGAAGHRALARAGHTVSLTEPAEAIVVETFDALPEAKAWRRFLRTQQEMLWRRTRESFVRRAEAHLAELDRTDAMGPGRLELPEGFEPPAYARREIHLQPGGYTDDPIGGIVHHYGTKIFYQGMNDADQHHGEFAALAVAPADGKVARVLDIGCSLGQATLPLKARFPDAEVWGLDVSRPMVRYAHHRAVTQGVAVNFRQGLAEATGFPDGHFDMILSYIIFHELPIAVIPKVLAEIFRVLRPGGVLSIHEFPNAPDGMPAAQRYMVAVDSADNCEPYSPDFVRSDFRGMVRAAGFTLKEGPRSSNGFLQSIIATKP